MFLMSLEPNEYNRSALVAHSLRSDLIGFINAALML